MNSRNLFLNLLIVFVFTAKLNVLKEVNADVTDKETSKTDSFECRITESRNGTKIKSFNPPMQILKSLKNNLYRCDSDEYRTFLCQLFTVYVSNGMLIFDNSSKVKVLLEKELLQKIEELLKVDHLGVLPSCLNTSELKNITKLNSANVTETFIKGKKNLLSVESMKSQKEIKKTNVRKIIFIISNFYIIPKILRISIFLCFFFILYFHKYLVIYGS